jgi:glutathione S-transferase
VYVKPAIKRHAGSPPDQLAYTTFDNSSGILDARDKAYFQQTREKRFGMSLEQLATQREQSLRALREGLGPLRAMLAEQPFVAGQAPGFSDYIVFAYRERMLDLYDGFGRKAACAGSREAV